MRNKIISAALDNIAKSATESMAKGLAKTSIGLIPIAGDIVVFFIDLGLDYSKEKAEAKQNLNEINNSIDSIRAAEYSSRLQLDTVVISDGTSGQQIIIYPSPKTQFVIDNINEYVKSKEIDLSKYNLTYPIDVDDVLSNSKKVNKLLNEELTLSERNYILDPNN